MFVISGSTFSTVTSIRLYGGNYTSGNVEVYWSENGTWRSICDNGWSSYQGNARVICRMLGFPT